MTMYSYRSDGTITKFDADGNVESAYTVSEDACTCPAGHRHTCRHRQMLPDLLPIADTHWFLDWDNNHTIVDFSGVPQSYYREFESAPLEGEIISPSDPYTEARFVSELFAKDITPIKPWRRL